MPVRELISLSDFQTGIGAAAHAPLDRKGLISHTRTALADTIASLQGSDGEVITASDVCEISTEIHDILDNGLSKNSW